MTLFKNVNGERIEMSAQEEADQLAEWAANALPPTQEEIDALNEKLTNTIMLNDKRLRVMMSVIFDLYDKLDAAGVAGFPSLTNQQKWDYVKGKI